MLYSISYTNGVLTLCPPLVMSEACCTQRSELEVRGDQRTAMLLHSHMTEAKFPNFLELVSQISFF